MRWPPATRITIKLGLAAIIRSVLVFVNWPAENMSLSLIALKIGVDLKVRIKFNATITSILAEMRITCYGHILQNYF